MHFSGNIIRTGVSPRGRNVYTNSTNTQKDIQHHWSLRRCKSIHGLSNLVYCNISAVILGRWNDLHRFMSLNTQIPAGGPWFRRLWNLEVKHCWRKSATGRKPRTFLIQPTLPAHFLFLDYGCDQLPHASAAEFPVMTDSGSSNCKPK